MMKREKRLKEEREEMHILKVQTSEKDKERKNIKVAKETLF